VAGGEIVWNAELFLYRFNIRGVQHRRSEARILEVLHPTRTAAAARIPMDRNHWLLGGKGHPGLQQGRNGNKRRSARLG
jgi:hypothetical protein